ncbi:hypothetical protein IFR05_002186 [Cadophora sp. M221]|nr:hypothetical protein IFR05_002186 [Cadophora sp. M221]
MRLSGTNIGDPSTTNVAASSAARAEIEEEVAEPTPYPPFPINEYVSMLENHPIVKRLSSQESMLALVSELYQRNILLARNELIKHEIVRMVVQYPSGTPEWKSLQSLYEPLFQKWEKSDQGRIQLERLAKALKIRKEWENYKRLQLDTNLLVGSHKRKGYLRTLIERAKPLRGFLVIWAIIMDTARALPFAEEFGHESRAFGRRACVLGAVMECAKLHDPNDSSEQTGSGLGREFYSKLLSKVNSEENVLADKRGTWDEFLSRLYIGGWALTAPKLIMALHQSLLTSLVTTSVFVIAVAVALAWFMKDAQAKDIIGATAAYAAVLVVFVGTDTSTSLGVVRKRVDVPGLLRHYVIRRKAQDTYAGKKWRDA